MRYSWKELDFDPKLRQAAHQRGATQSCQFEWLCLFWPLLRNRATLFALNLPDWWFYHLLAVVSLGQTWSGWIVWRLLLYLADWKMDALESFLHLCWFDLARKALLEDSLDRELDWERKFEFSKVHSLSFWASLFQAKVAASKVQLRRHQPCSSSLKSTQMHSTSNSEDSWRHLYAFSSRYLSVWRKTGFS